MKKILALLLAAVMLLTCFAAAFAESEVKDEPAAAGETGTAAQRDPYEKDEDYVKGMKARKEKRYWSALRYFKRSADNGFAMGQYEYANCMENGWGTEKRYAVAYTYYRKAAVQGNATAEAALGRCYLWGRGTDKDPAAGVTWLMSSAEKGDALGQLWLGYCYQKGLGVEKDTEAARSYYTLSLEGGNTYAGRRLRSLG